MCIVIWDYYFFYNFMLPDISFATCPPVPVEIIMAQGVSIFQGEQYSNRCPCCFSAAVSCLSARCHMVFVTTVVTINFWCWNVISIKHAQPQSVHFFAWYVIYDTTVLWSLWEKSNAIFHLCYLEVHVEIHLVPSMLSPNPNNIVIKCTHLHFLGWYHH